MLNKSLKLNTQVNLLQKKIQRLFSTIKFDVEKPQFHLISGEDFNTQIETTKEKMIDLYKLMYTMRRMEITSDNLYKQQQIRGFCHLYDGQEGVIAGIEKVLNFDDCLITAYRDHCHALTRGATVHEIIAEMLGKETGSSKGKGGSMHYYNKKNNFYGGNGIVGAQIPVGAGLAYSQKYLNQKNCTVTMYGDGAANQGQINEAANMAALWNLPLIMVCENNHYAMGTSTKRSTKNDNYHARDPVIPGIKVDAQNVFNVIKTMEYAKKYAIEKGPMYLEMSTYRYHGHSMSDPGISYRSREEVMEVRNNRDPLTILINYLQKFNFFDEKEITQIEKQVKQEVDDAVSKAQSDPFPNEVSLITDVYYDNDNHYIRGVELKDSIMHGKKALY